MKKALICGSFDPVTLGHMNIVQRAAKLFDEVTVGIFVNASKHYTFSESVRAEMISAACAELGLENVRVDVCSGLVASYVRENGIDVIVKGVRNTVDFEYEKNMAEVNKLIYDGAETLLLVADERYGAISSSLVREMMSHGVDVSALLPGAVMEIAKQQ